MSNYSYALQAPCGCVRGAVVDDGSPTVPTLVAESIRRGYRAIWLETRIVRDMRWNCDSGACQFKKTSASAPVPPPFETTLGLFTQAGPAGRDDD